jgi:elongation factor P--(R)-beta-lysine ligase
MSAHWQPTAAIEHLRRRAQLLADIRAFFSRRGVLEVETPLLCHGIGTDPQLDFFHSTWRNGAVAQTLYLQTSPEFSMKRLLAAGSGCIFQIGKAFRQGESGRFHNPEFTLLEWYRLDFDLSQLMDEISDLLQALLPGYAARRYEYRLLFQSHTDLDPLIFTRADYRRQAQVLGFPEADDLCGDDHAIWLDFLFSHAVQPHMNMQHIVLVYGYPAVLSSLARLNASDARVSERVEVFVNRIELGNGYHELTDAVEQERRFECEITYRQQHGLPPVQKDQRLLEALRAGLPNCSGMAIGLERLLMVACDAATIDDVLAFAIAQA